ncbi:DUF2637 domain-containing protein [Streptomyces sp. NPDC056390]|uniref:DUF2637 domain-containing protein n=1 Tax=Streptomyces sp. NPDC056390 TaxID=3345806 RepID=UPI0035E01419
MEYFVVHIIAEAAGQSGWKAWAYPVSVDLLMIAAWRRMRSDVPTQRKGAWFWFGLALAASLAANIGTAGVLDLTDLPTPLRVIVGGWPALAFLGGTLLSTRARRTRSRSPSARGPTTSRRRPLTSLRHHRRTRDRAARERSGEARSCLLR